MRPSASYKAASQFFLRINGDIYLHSVVRISTDLSPTPSIVRASDSQNVASNQRHQHHWELARKASFFTSPSSLPRPIDRKTLQPSNVV